MFLQPETLRWFQRLLFVSRIQDVKKVEKYDFRAQGKQKKQTESTGR